MEPKDIPLSRLKYKPTRWLWRGCIPYGSLTLLAGRSEVGKSSLLTEIAARVSRGRSFPDSDEARRQNSEILPSSLREYLA